MSSRAKTVLCAATLGFLTVCASAMDRYMDVYNKVKRGPKMKMSKATFFGADGTEEFVGLALSAEGQIVAVGNSWGPPFPEHADTRVVGWDRLHNIRLRQPDTVSGFRHRWVKHPPVPSDDHPNRTGFMVFYSGDLSRVERIMRFGWGTASITAARRLRDGSFLLVGAAHRPLDGVSCPDERRHRQLYPAGEGFKPTEFDGITQAGDVYVAKLLPDFRSFAWVWTLEGFGDAPDAVHEGENGTIIVKCRSRLWRITGDGAEFRDFRGTTLHALGHRMRGVNPENGQVITGGSFLIGTGREPWKQPFMDVFNSDGEHIESYYWWTGALAGHDDFRLVSDSRVDRLEPLPDGSYVISGHSDGGNSAFTRHPADLSRGAKGKGLPMSTWGAGVAGFQHVCRFHPEHLDEVYYTLWSSFSPTGPTGMGISRMRGFKNGSVAILGYAPPYLVQTTHKWFRATTHYFRKKGEGYHFNNKGWPVFQGLGGHGYYVAVLTPEMDNLLWASTIATVVHRDVLACEKGLVAVGRAFGVLAGDSRTPALLHYDIADWPGLITKLVSASAGNAPSAARQVWARFDMALQRRLKSHPAGRKPDEALKTAVADALDEILFDDRTFYDAALWPNLELDGYESSLLERLKQKEITEEELGYLNRALLEQTFPEHVYARPRHNFTPVLDAIQPRYGGGPTDGYIYLLEPPPGMRLDKLPPTREPVTAPARRRARPRARARKKGAGSGREMAGTIAFPHPPAERRKLKLPGYCMSYVILRNAEKARPMFLNGWGESGVLKVSYDNNGGLDEEVTTTASGSAVLLLNQRSGFPSGAGEFGDGRVPTNWKTYACGEWLLPENDAFGLRVTFKALRNLVEETDVLAKLVDPGLGILSESRKELVAKFTATVDLELSIGEHKAPLRDVPCRLALRQIDVRGRWAMRLDLNTSFEPGRLGLAEEGEGPVTVKLVHGGFAPVPSAQKAPGKKGSAISLDDEMDLFE